MKLLTVTQWAKARGISPRRARALVSQGRVPQAVRIGSYWAIPAGAKPTVAKGRWG